MNVSKGELKARMFEYFREIQRSGQALVVTDRGTPVLIIQPYAAKKSIAEAFAHVHGRVKYQKDAWSSENDEWGELA